MRTFPRIFRLVVWCAIATIAAAAPPQYQIFDIGVIQAGDTASQGFGASPGGVAVGRSVRSNASQAFSWTVGGGLVGLPNLSGRNHAVSNDANDYGIVVGTAATTLFGSSRLPVIWNDGVVSQLQLPPGETIGDANAVNALAVAVGSVDGGSLQQGAIYNYLSSQGNVITATTATGCTFVTAFGINDSNRIVGQGIDPNNAARNVGIVYDIGHSPASEVGALPGANGAIAFGVSNGGHVVGSSMMNQGSGQPFIWTSGAGILAIPLAAGTSQGSARAVNSAGWVVGQDSSAFSIPFLWDGTTTYRLADLLPPGSGWDLEMNTSSSALGISDNGTIVGTGVHNGETHAYAMVPVQATPTPTPGPVTHFAVSAPMGVVFNQPFNFTVSARDAANNIVPGYAGTVHYTSTSGGAQLPPDGPLTNGTGTRSATFQNGGTITATDTANPSITGTSNNITVIIIDPTATPSPTPTPTATPPPTPPPTATPCLGVVYQENFDGVVAPNLPANWTASFTSGAADCTPTGTCAQGTNWVTTTTGSDTAPNCAFHNAPSCVTDSNLNTRSFAIPAIAGGNQLYFRHSYDLESGRDGGVLEISIAGGAFTDIITAGGSFALNGYNGTISTGFLSPIGGRPAWTGSSGGYITTGINLPTAASGQNVVFRFRLATDCSGAGTGWRVDTITGTLPEPCQTPSPTPPATPTPTPGPATHFQVVAPTMCVRNMPCSFTVTARDQFNNTATNYAGTVHYTSSDGSAELPMDGTLTNGTGSRSAIFHTEGSQTITATDTVTPSVTGTSNPIQVFHFDPTPTPSPTPTPPLPTTDYAIAMTDAPDPVQVGQNLTYAITVTNTGPDFGVNVTMTDTLPAGVTYVSATPSQGSCTGTSTVTCNLGVFQTSVTITLVVTPTVAGQLSNTANVVYQGDPNPSNNSSTAMTKVVATPTPSPSPTPSPTPGSTPTKALNLSTRMRVQTGNNVGIGGFIITGNASKNVAIRGIGPSLSAFGITDALADPTLELRDSNGGLIKGNDDWQENAADAAQLTSLGLAPQNSKEAGLVATLQPGSAYTAVLAGKNQGVGVGLLEIYDVSQGSDSQLANISTRSFVQTGNDVTIAGFILGGNSNPRIVVRGLGPSLEQFGLSPVLADPTLELRDNNGTLLIANNDWQNDPTGQTPAQLIALGLAPQNARESGIVATLPPGAYTAILAGANSGTGIGLVEIYNVH